MGRSPQATRWNGHVYPTIGWAIGDALLLYPTMNDQDLAALLDVTVARIQYWRTKAGIPPADKRRGSYYMRDDGDIHTNQEGAEGERQDDT